MRERCCTPVSPSSAALKLAFSRAQRERRQAEHLAAPTAISASSRASGTTVFTRPMSSASCAEYWQQRNQISFALLADLAREHRRAEAAVEAPDTRPGLAEARVVRGDRRVAEDVQDVATADGVTGHHRDDRLRQAPHLHVEVGHVKAADRRAARHVAGVTAHALVASNQKASSLTGQHDHADVRIVARCFERVRELDDRLRAEMRCAPRGGRS